MPEVDHSPQCEDGFTRIANELLEALTGTRLSGRQWQIILLILRNTYGFSRKEWKTSNQEIAKLLKMHRQHTYFDLKELAKRNVILVTENGYGRGVTIGIQKNYGKWSSLPKTVTVTENGYDSSPKTVTVPLKKKERKRRVSQNNPEKRTGKRTVAKFSPPTGSHLKSNGNPWIDPEAWDDFVQHRTDIKKPLTELAVKKLIELLSEFKTVQREMIDTAIRCRWTGVFAPKKSFKSSDDVDGPRLRILEPAPYDR